MMNHPTRVASPDFSIHAATRFCDSFSWDIGAIAPRHIEKDHFAQKKLGPRTGSLEWDLEIALSTTFRRFFSLAATVLLLSCFFPGKLLAHPFHISIGEMEWNATSQKWEVAVRVQSTDLQTAVRRFTKTQVDVDGENIPDELVVYLSEHFYLSTVTPAESRKQEANASKSKAPASSERSSQSDLKWVGHEVERGWMWLYFELTPPKSDKELHLTNALLLEVVEGQTNTMLVRSGDKRHSIQTTGRMKSEKLPASVQP
jgi:hypothetical protein